MHKASNALSVLQATAAILALAILLWSLGLPSFHFVEAANVTSFSDTLSDSAPGVDSNHTIQFTSPTGIANGQTIVLDFTDGTFNTTGVDYTDIDISTSTPLTLATDCSGSEHATAVFSGDILTITLCAGAENGHVNANGTTTIKIGTNATSQVAGDQQINNAAAGSYQIPLTAGASDSGETRVAILDTVLVTASVDTLFTFTVSGRPTGTVVNTFDTTGGTTTATQIAFGRLTNTASTAAQLLTVTTNAKNGYSVTVEADGMLDSSNGADIDGFINGAYTMIPTAWTTPAATPGSENTYGHWGITTDDATLTGGADFDNGGSGNRFVSASTSPIQVMSHEGPVNGIGEGVGTTTVGYKVQISGLQEAAEDYTAVLTYIATPVF
jgi:hypothetical protein